MPFNKVPAPIHRDGVSVAVVGPRRVRAPLRHSVDGAPTGNTSTATRHYFRSSYADPTVANSADPYVKSTSRDSFMMTSSVLPDDTNIEELEECRHTVSLFDSRVQNNECVGK